MTNLSSVPMSPPTMSAATRRYVYLGTFVVVLIGCGLYALSASVKIAGAILAHGNVVVDSNVKRVQHPSGGVVGSIHVKDGQLVQAGELLVQLDPTVLRANLQVITKQLDELAVRQARLSAEENDIGQIAFSERVLARKNEPVLAEIMASETTLFSNRTSARNGLKAQLRERIEQLHEEVDGLNAQRKARAQELSFAQAELEGLEQLEGQKLVSVPRITSARRTVAQLEGDIAQVDATTAQANGKITETELQILQIDQDLRAEVGRELRDLQARVSELTERQVAATDQLDRVDIRAPHTGFVHQLNVHTVGGVIGPSEPIMYIVPSADHLVIEAKVAPQDIDQVKVDQIGYVRFPAFNQRTTPDMMATVTRISADLIWETAKSATTASDSAPYYRVRLTLAQKGNGASDEFRLLPGMPAEVHITTSERTMLSYLAKPLTDQFSRAFRER